MSRDLLMVFSYDVSRTSTRTKVAGILESEMARVQKSVFEGRMTRRAADRLADRILPMLEEGDSLRVYAVTPVGLRHSRALGALPLAEPHDYWLL